MKKHTSRKALALTLVMSMAFTLTSCYVPPDEITDTGYQTGVNGVPWDSVVEPTQIPTAVPITAIPATDAPTPTPTIAPWTGSATQTAWQLPATQTPSRTATPVPTAGSLKLGATGTDVMALQRRLQELGYYSGNIDGDFGAETELAVKAFQRVNGLTVDGKVGVNTLSRINSSSALAATATPAPKASLKLGSTGAEVRTLQRRLQELGYYTGTIDGDFGSSTEKAVKAFQRMNGLTVDGKVGEQTWKVLNSRDAVRARSEAPQQTEKQQAAVRTTAASTNAGNQHVGNELPVPAQTNTSKPGKATATPKPEKATATPKPEKATATPKPDEPRQTATIKPGNALPIIDENGNAAIITAIPATEPVHTTAPQTIVTPARTATPAPTPVMTAPPPLQTLIPTEKSVTARPATATPRRTATATPRRTATRVPARTPVPTATPKTDIYLSVGKSGAEVRTLQARLIELGYLSGKATGSFDGATDAAVRAFQQRMGLWVDGKAGPLTLDALYSSRARQASKVVASVGETLQLGMQGADVRALQTRLRELGYLASSADGSYGENTRNAVMAFQQQNGLTPDGVAGSATLHAIYATGAPKASPSPSPSPTPDPIMTNISSTGYIPLRQGDHSDQVSMMQHQLKQQGYYSGLVDGRFGTGTEAAVIAFQAANYLKPDGVAGPATQRVLFGTDGGTIPYTDIHPGEKGSHVANVQYALYELYYYEGEINGVYDQLTQDAVREFQAVNGLSNPDGTADGSTLRLLYSCTAISAIRPLTEMKTLRLDDIGEEVLELKSALVSLGYLDALGDNRFDEATYTAVMLFQTQNGLKPTGVASPETQQLLYSGHALPQTGNE